MRAARSVVGWVLFGLMTGLAGAAQAGTDLHLLGDRFRVSATWRTAAGANGTATAIPLTDETGLFWFFSRGNVELVVKVLDACAPPYERFWFYASGLTDVEVELTVEDTWIRQTKSYLRPSGSLFAPLADTSTFTGCGVPPPAPPCGQGTRAEIAATPRPNFDAEALALLLGPGITADPEIYARIDDDLARIRALRPSLADIEFFWIWHPSSFSLKLTPEAYAAAKAGTFKEWDCLNDWYGARSIKVYDFGPWASIGFEGRFQIPRIGVDYAALPGVEHVETYGNELPASNNSPDDLCVAIDGVAYEYFFYEGWGVDRLWSFRVSYAGAIPIALGSFGLGDPSPGGWPRYEQCQQVLANAAYQ